MKIYIKHIYWNKTINLASLLNGASVIACNNEHFGKAENIFIMFCTYIKESNFMQEFVLTPEPRTRTRTKIVTDPTPEPEQNLSQF